MKLLYLVINDIGPFRGNHVFDFNGAEGKTGFAIFSKNGRQDLSVQRYEVVSVRGSLRTGRGQEREVGRWKKEENCR